ncbi:Endoribonuclease L-PSP [Fulvivirga imtechensis AK7]|uniref:Endoribonuclease L-PSP n=1 Tax=Fulvivirga imtechensis AK7 TaxID=1237149 RepID=L8K034_9BACT|nr:RidA family protein [Fulvivirga imtechensis]ELR72827.1 Endoribonuclease L-PSP [Fulvivirga imtechensis AK7]
MRHTIIIIGCLLLVGTTLAQNPEQKLNKLGIELIEPTKPIANYVKAVRTGNLVFLSGHGPSKADGTSVKGKVGADLGLEEGREAARLAAISLLSTLRAEIGDLNKVVRIVKVTGMVNCTPDFYDQPKVINGCSDLLVEVFGDKGRHARAAVGMVSLPSNITVEIDMVVEVE